VRYAFVRDHVHEYPVEILCQVMKLSRSCYYRWLKDGAAEQSPKRLQQAEHVRNVFESRKGRYGSPRIYRELKALGINISKARHKYSSDIIVGVYNVTIPTLPLANSVLGPCMPTPRHLPVLITPLPTNEDLPSIRRVIRSWPIIG
jgi:hypothetical protein